MTRHELNEVFLRTSFLQGANATYLADLHARYEENPASVDPEWRAFFASLNDDKADVLAEARGPSWAPTDGKALAPAFPLGLAGEQQAIAAARDTLAARMLIRNYRTRGHLAAKLDPLELVTRREHAELKPKTYGFTKADYDRPIYIGGAFGLEFATLREILAILRRTYSGPIGVEYMHISDPEQRAWIQERIEGRDVSFTAKGKKAILKKLIEAESF
jgi:2-oxoglutarate dehydrogenase E1 component